LMGEAGCPHQNYPIEWPLALYRAPAGEAAKRIQN